MQTVLKLKEKASVESKLNISWRVLCLGKTKLITTFRAVCGEAFLLEQENDILCMSGFLRRLHLELGNLSQGPHQSVCMDNLRDFCREKKCLLCSRDRLLWMNKGGKCA